jgi:hypothetical protein
MSFRLSRLQLALAALSLVGTGLYAATPAPEGTLQASMAAPHEAEDMGEIAKKLNDPTASLISLPFQNNFDWGAGPDGDGFQYKLNVQPVIPIKLNDDWKIIWRTILPFITQEDVIGTSSQTGLGDLNTTIWLSPNKKAEGQPTIGIGPILQFPTATDDLLGAEKWAIGPSFIFVHQSKGWTAGILANHLWSVAGDEDRQDLSVTFLQPFLSYTTPKHTTFGINSESGYDWENEQWTIPINVFITQLVKIGKLPVSFQLGARYYAEAPEQGPEWGLRFSATLVLPE